MSKILFFVSSMHSGGSERVSALLCNRWAEQGHEVILVPTFSGRGTCQYPLDERVQLIYLADRVKTSQWMPGAMFRRFLAMRQLVCEKNPDRVLSFLSHVNVATLFATRGLSVSVVVSERTYPPASSLGLVWAWLRRISYPWATRVIMQTKDGRDWLSQEIPSAQGAVIPNPSIFPLPLGQPQIIPDTIVPSSRRLLLAVGRLQPVKQFNLAIQTFAALAPRFSEWDLVIIGEGPERADLEAKVKAEELSGRVHLPGLSGNVGDWYPRADLFIMTSLFEGFPNVLIEALAHGLPAVSLDCATGPADLIDNGVNGYLVSPDAGTDGLIERLSALMVDPQLRQEFAERAIEVRERYALEKVGAEWDRVLELES